MERSQDKPKPFFGHTSRYRIGTPGGGKRSSLEVAADKIDERRTRGSEQYLDRFSGTIGTKGRTTYGSNSGNEARSDSR